MPNHRKIAREFTLFDNGYVSGTNSADGHAWSTQCLANDYLEHFYVGYSRTYPDDGDCAMSISNGGALWDAALKKGQVDPRLGRVLRRQARHLRPQAEGLVRGLGRPDKRDAPVQVHRRHERRQPQAANQPRGALLAAAPERPVPRGRLHPRIRGIQPAATRSPT